MKTVLQQDTTQARVLIVDDEPSNVMLLEKILKYGKFSNIKSIHDSRDVLTCVTAFQPDILLLDLHMPHMDGYAVLTHLRETLTENSFLPVLVLTADVTSAARERALDLGANDFLAKPFDPLEVLLRIKNLVKSRFLYTQLTKQNVILEHKVRERTVDLEHAAYEIAHRLALAAEFRDDVTGQHTNRVGEMACLVGMAVGMDNNDATLLRHAAALHDVGKIGVCDSILLKPGKLTPEEFASMKDHVQVGGNILSGSKFPLLQMAEDVARYHHEHWNGNGYKCGLKGEEIPLCARIVAVADVFDALISERSYKPAWPLDKAFEEIKRLQATQFDPRVVEAFLDMAPEVRNIVMTYQGQSRAYA